MCFTANIMHSSHRVHHMRLYSHLQCEFYKIARQSMGQKKTRLALLQAHNEEGVQDRHHIKNKCSWQPALQCKQPSRVISKSAQPVRLNAISTVRGVSSQDRQPPRRWERNTLHTPN